MPFWLEPMWGKYYGYWPEPEMQGPINVCVRDTLPVDAQQLLVCQMHWDLPVGALRSNFVKKVPEPNHTTFVATADIVM